MMMMMMMMITTMFRMNNMTMTLMMTIVKRFRRQQCCDNLFESYVWLRNVCQFTQMKRSVRDSFNNQAKRFSLL